MVTNQPTQLIAYMATESRAVLCGCRSTVDRVR